MKNDYRKLEKKLDELEKAQSEFTRIANLRIGMISGAPSIDAERKRLDSVMDTAEQIVFQFCQNGARLSTLRDYVSDWRSLIEIVENESIERDFIKQNR